MVQDYFKYDKIQGGTSLVINANDGTKTQEKLGLPLGIKSTTQGLTHFTNWNDISSSIDAKNTLRFEDLQPNKLFYRTNRTRAVGLDSINIDTGAASSVAAKVFSTNGISRTEFTDEWSVEDIKILDDIAVVSYPDYTDIQRTEATFTGLSILQPIRRTYVGSYVEENTSFDWYGGLVFSVDGLPLMHQVGVLQTISNDNYYIDDTSSTGLTTLNPQKAAQIHLDNQFYNFENTILKVKIPRTSYAAQTDLSERYLYFVYGGATSCGSMPTSLSANPDGSFTFDDFRFSTGSTQYSTIYNQQDTTRNWDNFDDGDFAGYFYLITEESSTLGRDRSNERTPSGNVHIQLSVSAVLSDSEAYTAFISKYQSFSDATTSQHVGYITVGDYSPTPSCEATFIKFTPVRKCGKVEIYTKKSGIINSIVNNRITSPGHTLQTNDIIKITSALWDGTQTGAKDSHPLNGNKFVKIIDDDTFDLFEDQYFLQPVSTTKLKTTTGISWVCIGSSNSNEAQSWKYVETLFSPTGRNGYKSTTNKYKTTTRYNNAFLAPSNSADRDIYNNSLYLDFSIFRDAGTSRESLIFGGGTNWGIYNTYGILQKHPTYSSYTEASKLGAMISKFLEDIPVKDLGDSPLDAFHKGPQDFFPFTTNSINTQFTPPYTGTRFGASIDFKFSHVSGNSKIYTLAIGEPGSDVSVDMFGLNAHEYAADSNYPFWLYTSEGSNPSRYGIGNIGRKRVMPYYQPHGKVHIFTVTVDQYGKISDITSQNSVFGDGSSVNNTCSNEEHPWDAFMDYVRANNYVGVDTNSGRRQIQSWAYRDGVFDTSYASSDNGSSVSYITMQYRAPFYEILPDNSSLYWDRASIANWFGISIYDYFTNTNNINGDLLRQQYATRNFAEIDGSSVFFSRFGTNIGDYAIDRFNISNTNTGSQFYIMPWVDMFGKSVAISKTNSSGEILVFGSASVRSNIDYHSVPRSDYNSSGDYGETALRPVYADNAGISNLNSATTTVSQVGQISCIRLDINSSYNTTQIVEINSGGSVDSSATPVDSGEVIERETTNAPTFTIKELRDGDNLGGDYVSVSRSLRTSAMSIIFEDDYLFWSDHNIYGAYSTINMFQIDHSNNSFDQRSSIISNFVNQLSLQTSSDGCGSYMKYDNGLLITNMLVSHNTHNKPVRDYLAIDKYDAIAVYEADQRGLKYLQLLTGTFSSLDERYTSKLLRDYKDEILDIGNITYDNNTYQSHTWNMRMSGKYDVVSGNIILKDPVEYVLFGADDSYDRLLPKTTSSYTRGIYPYFKYTEVFKDDTVYYDYANSSQYTIQDKSLWDSFATDELSNIENITRTPIFFLSLPDSSMDLYGNIVITITRGSLNKIFGSYWNLADMTQTAVSNAFNSLTPKIAFYKKDPRAMIVPNGPAVSDSSSSAACPYTNGIYDYWWSTFNKNDQARMQVPATPPLFRGGANDLFNYYSNPQTVPSLMPVETNSIYDYSYARTYFNGEKNLGELFDLTYNELGNTNKGIISWFANDVRNAAGLTGGASDVEAIQYGQLYSGFIISAGPDTYRLTIPYSVWSDYVINEDVIKDSSQNRPLFNDFTRIKHGVAGNNVDPSNGTWDYNYNDINRPSYNASRKRSNITLMLGLVFNRQATINQDGSTAYDASNPVNTLLRHFVGSQSTRARWGNRYSYTPLFGDTNIGDTSQNFANRSHANNLDCISSIDNINFEINGETVSKKKYKTKFHKIAYFEYNNEIYSEAQRHLMKTYTNNVERYAFGRYSFTPFAVGPLRNTQNQTNVYTSKNPIIRLGKSKSSTVISDTGSFSESIQVLTSDSVGATNSIDASFYAKDNTLYDSVLPSGYSLGTAYFANRSMLGGFDISKPQALTLSIFTPLTSKEGMDLFIKDQRGSGSIDLSVYGNDIKNKDLTLFVTTIDRTGEIMDLSVRGVLQYNIDSDLFIRGADINDLNKNIDLSVFGTVDPGSNKGVELSIAGPRISSGVTPLFIGKDIDSTKDLPLFIQSTYVTPGYAFKLKTADLNIEGLPENTYVYGSGASLYIAGPDKYILNTDTSLYITTDIPDTGRHGYIGSGATTLSIDANNDSQVYTVYDTNSPMFIEGAIASTGSIPLYIQRPLANALSLTIKNQNPTGVFPLVMSGAFVGSGAMSLSVSPPTNNNTNLFTRGYVE